MADVTISKNDLKDIISSAVAAAVAEARKPAPPTDEEKRAIEQKQTDRKEQADLILADIEKKRADQKLCTHKHRNGVGHGVYIQDGNYILCQKCNVKVRPEPAPRGYKGGDIYDTALFSRMFQELPSNNDAITD